MSDESSVMSAEQSERDFYTISQSRERVLNSAIIRADISQSFEEYLEIFDRFYANDIEVSSETREERFRGKARVRSLLADFLIPLHVMAEIGGLLISVREHAIPSDTSAETHSEWTLEFIGVSGRTCALSWRVFRKWNGPLVVYEHHYDYQRSGGPLTSSDLSLYVASPAPGFRRPS
jgi:hypothetical protein